ncbi:hypothetical protein [Ostreiculturibacter nitratireducens]|uniref:hypothetical protein n=1 Tax=Ostreiculturibacter nitratireducens TaxID=3075226 RepID=UPI0031B5DCA3
MTISTWKMNGGKGVDAAITALREKFMPTVRTFGATQAMSVQTGPDTMAVIAVYPDEATRDKAAEKIAGLRGRAASDLDTTMTGEMKGEVVASA